MIIKERLNSEIDLSKRVYLYYFDKMADNLSIGSDKYIPWYKDLCVLYYLCEGLISIKSINNKFYIGDSEVNEDDLALLSSSVREYINYDIRDIVYTELDTLGNVKDYILPITPPTIVTYQGFNQDWRSIIIDVLVDDVATLTLPFDISSVDPDSIRITVGDNDPIHLVLPNQEGAHIIGTTLYWHTYYNLKAGDRVFIQYLINIV